MEPNLGLAGILRLDGCNLHYWLIGPEWAPVVVFTAGATADRRLFLPQVPAISEHYRMLLWDVRGHGLSQPAGERPTAQRATTDLIALLDHLGFDRVAYVGQSFGGMIGQELIFQQPERVIAAVMLGAPNLTMRLSLLERIGLDLAPLLVRLYPRRLFLRHSARNAAVTEPARHAFRDMLAGLSPAAIHQIFTGLAESMHEEPGFTIEIPLLICHGDQDRLGNIARIAPQWAAQEPRAELAIIPHAGHNANMDNPAAFNRLLLDFLDRHVSQHA